MNIRPKTIRRLVLLTGVVALIAALALSVWAWHNYSKKKKLLADRNAGIALYEQGDYVAAMEKLRKCVGPRNPNDFDALFAYAVSRYRVESGSHIKDARALFMNLLNMRPDHLPTAHMLLDLYSQISYNSEAIDLADKVLTKHPTDVPSLRAKAQALARAGKNIDALNVSVALNEAAPLDLEGQIQTRELMMRLKRPATEVIAHFAALQQKYPDDPRFEMLLGAAYAYAQDVPETLRWLRQAANRPPPDATFVRRLSRAFDDLKLFDESQQLLERAADLATDPAITRVLVERLWQSDRFEEVANRLKDLDPADARSDATLLAYRAMALVDLKREAEARQIIDALQARKGDNVAASWAAALEAHAQEQPRARETIARLDSALARNPDNGVLSYWIGECYLRVGEMELAKGKFRDAADAMPSWVKPHIMIARSALALGQTEEALEAARAARKGAPNQLASAKVYAAALHQWLSEHPDAEQAKALLQFVTLIQQQKPGEPETLPIYASLLARLGNRDAAVDALRKALDDPSKLDGELLSRLLAVSRAEKLELDDEIYAAMPAELAASPRVLFERAIEVARDGNTKQGLAMLTAAARGQSDVNQWKLLICQYRDVTNDPTAREEWMALGNTHPGDAAIQTAILKHGRSARADRDFYAITIDRVRKLTGDAGHLWRTHRVRWLLGEGRPKDSAEAVSLMTDLVRFNDKSAEYRLLLAQALLSLPNSKDTTQSAIGHLKKAVELDPASVPTILTLSRLLMAQNDLVAVRTYLDLAVKASPRSVEQRQETAVLLAQTGDLPAAYELLKPVEDQLNSEGQLMLAELSRRQGNLRDADRLFRTLLSNPSVSADALAAAADFYASQGRNDEVATVLNRLEDSRFSSIQRSKILAKFHEMRGEIEPAREHYLAAATDAAGDVAAWKELINFNLRNAQYDQAVLDAEAAMKLYPAETELNDLRAQAVAMKATAGEQGDLQPLIDVLVKDPKNASQVELLRVIQEVRNNKLPLDQAIARLKPVADKYVDHFPTQSLLVRWQLAAGRVSDAAAVAERAMESRPNDADAAQLAVGVYESASRWREMKRSAEKWRQRTLDRPQRADYALAEAQLHLDEHAAALAQVQPYLEAAKLQPEKNLLPLRVAAQAMVKLNRAAEAGQLLQPLLGRSAEVRQLWASLAGNDITDASIARQWLETLSPAISTETSNESFVLARAWREYGRRFSDVPATQQARSILRAIQDHEDVSAEALMLLASVEFEQNDPAAAEKAYRQALRKQPDLADAQNNLAYLILLREGDLQEAKTFAAQAVQARGSEAGFHDTLGRICLRLGERAQAIVSFEQAIKLNPKNLEAMIGLALALQAEGAADKAGELLRQIEQLLRSGMLPSAPVQQELQSLREALSRSTE